MGDGNYLKITQYLLLVGKGGWGRVHRLNGFSGKPFPRMVVPGKFTFISIIPIHGAWKSFYSDSPMDFPLTYIDKESFTIRVAIELSRRGIFVFFFTFHFDTFHQITITILSLYLYNYFTHFIQRGCTNKSPRKSQFSVKEAALID